MGDATALIASGRAALVGHNIVGASAAFAQAVAADPSNEEANTLYALTRVVVLETTPGVQKLLDEIGFPREGRDIFNWTARMSKHGFPAPGTTLTSKEGVTVEREVFLPELIGAEKNLALVTGTGFSTPLSAEETNLRAVTIDYGDIQMLRAMAEGAITTINLEESYDMQVGVTEVDTWYKANALSLEHMLSGYPKLLSFGKQVTVGTALAAFDSGVNDFVSAVKIIEGRTDNMTHLFSIDAEQTSNEATFEQYLQDAQASLATTVNFDQRTKVYLGGLERMTEPLRWYLPGFKGNHAILGATPGGVATTGTLPDATFGGTLLTVSPPRMDEFWANAGTSLDKAFLYKGGTSKSSVSITSPKSKGDIVATNPPNYKVTVTGHARKNALPSHVEVALNNDAGGAFVIATGTADWSCTFTDVLPGPNTVYARGDHTSGNYTGEVSRTFNYVITGTLPVTVNPQNGGSVPAAYVPSSKRQMAKRYVIKATPARGYIFQSWSDPAGLMTYSNQARYAFTMTQGLALRANFIPNPFPALAGNYAGQVVEDGSNAIGSVSFAVTKTGAFTGKLEVGGMTYGLKGELNSTGGAALVVSHGKGPALQVGVSFTNIAAAAQGISVTVDGTNTYGTAQANPSAGKTSLKGRYSIAMAPDKRVTESPQGDGYGTVTITKDGKVNFAGVLADGTRLTYSTLLTGTLGAEGWAAYVPLYGKQGSFSGAMRFHAPAAGDEIEGAPVWIKPEVLKAKALQKGFEATLRAVGSADNQ